MSATCPRLRDDLIISRQESSQGVAFILKDPLVGRFLRFREPEYFIAQQLDGATPLAEIRRRGEQHFGQALAESAIEAFTAKLQTLGLLDSAAHSAGGLPTRKAARVRGNLFYLRLKVLDPDALLGLLVPKLRWLFTPAFACLTLGVILLAAAVMMSNWTEIHRRLPGLLRVETIPLAWMSLWCIVLGHEFAHGLTCKHFGGGVHEIGLLLIYLQPAMYCNVSEAWMFPEKSKRLLVTLAGAWFEVFAWALATLFWRLTEPGTPPNYLALVVATTLGIRTLFNLNPLIKLDGYYLLSDLVEIPNLRKNAFHHIGDCIRTLWRPAQASVTQATARQRRIFWLYGVLAAAYSVGLIGFLLIGLGSFLVTRYKSWGLALFLATVAILFRSPLRRVLRGVASQVADKQSVVCAMKNLAKFSILLVIVAGSLYLIRTDLKVSGEFTIVPVRNAEIRAEVEGIIADVLHDEGDEVTAGDLMFRLSDRDYRAELQEVSSDIAEKEARLKLLKAGARPEEIALAQTTVTKGEEHLKYGQFYLEMERKLYGEKLSSKKDFELAEETVTLRQKELEESKGTLKLLLAGSRPEEIEATEAALSRLMSQRVYLQDQIKRLNIVSPIAGVVITHRLKEKAGAAVKKGETIASVQELRAVTAEIAIPEQEISEVRVGQPVVLKARARVGDRFQGKVVSIAPVASKPQEGVVQRTFLVTTELENPGLQLKGDMSGNAKITCGERRLYEIVFRRFIRFIRVEFWSWW